VEELRSDEWMSDEWMSDVKQINPEGVKLL
jgi:hypothetical protein